MDVQTPVVSDFKGLCKGHETFGCIEAVKTLKVCLGFSDMFAAQLTE